MKNTLLIIFSLCMIISANAQIESLSANPVKKNNITAADYKEIMTKWNGSVFSSKESFDTNISSSKQLYYYTQLFARPEVLKNFNNQKMVTAFVVPNSFFEKMEEEDRDAFMSEENAIKTSQMLLSFMVPGRIDSKTMMYEIEKRGGKPISLKTINGEVLEVTLKKDTLFISNSDGITVEILASNLIHSNGFFHIAEGFLMK